MRLEYHFNHMDRSEALEEFTRERLESVIDGVLHRDDCHVQVWFIAVHSRSLKGVPEFRAEIEIRYAPRKDFFVGKNSDDMHVAVVDAIDALRNHIKEDGKREIQLRRAAPSIAEIVMMNPEDPGPVADTNEQSYA